MELRRTRYFNIEISEEVPKVKGFVLPVPHECAVWRSHTLPNLAEMRAYGISMPLG